MRVQSLLRQLTYPSSITHGKYSCEQNYQYSTATDINSVFGRVCFSRFRVLLSLVVFCVTGSECTSELQFIFLVATHAVSIAVGIEDSRLPIAVCNRQTNRRTQQYRNEKKDLNIMPHYTLHIVRWKTLLDFPNCFSRLPAVI